MYLDIYRIENPKERHPHTVLLQEFGFEKTTSDEYATAAYKNDFEREFIGCDVSYCCDTMYWRPKEFAKERAWIKKTRKIPKASKLMLLEALGRVEKDPQLWFEYS